MRLDVFYMLPFDVEYFPCFCFIFVSHWCIYVLIDGSLFLDDFRWKVNLSSAWSHPWTWHFASKLFYGSIFKVHLIMERWCFLSWFPHRSCRPLRVFQKHPESKTDSFSDHSGCPEHSMWKGPKQNENRHMFRRPHKEHRILNTMGLEWRRMNGVKHAMWR